MFLKTFCDFNFQQKNSNRSTCVQTIVYSRDSAYNNGIAGQASYAVAVLLVPTILPWMILAQV